jgi:hypothetical protein
MKEGATAMGEDMKRLAIDIPEELHHRLRVYAINHKTTLADLFREKLEEVLAMADAEQEPKRKARRKAPA